VQIKILENHQNGKDTHLRGLQIFARNDEDLGRSVPEQGIKGSSGLNKAVTGGAQGMEAVKAGKKERARREERLELGRSAWDMDGDIR
jgi:anaphase-promoting complex subunit 10